MADLPAEVWTLKLRGQVRNFIKTDHDGDEDLAVSEVGSIFDSWSNVCYLMRLMKKRIAPVPSFYEFYMKRRDIRAALAAADSKMVIASDYKEVKL